MARKQVTYRPGKAQSVFGVVWGGIFVLIGLVVVIPAVGPFGVLWTLAAIAITGMNAYHAFGKKYIGPEINIEEVGTTENAVAPTQRLEQLRDMYDRRLITQEEYDQKRQEILSEL